MSSFSHLFQDAAKQVINQTGKYKYYHRVDLYPVIRLTTTIPLTKPLLGVSAPLKRTILF